ncbi:HEPN domain-containing protein [Thermus filiformis]|uniref:DNA-binding protein n=1 Tax=Thermus filiformis TaxID=276 RepID=A0A0D6XAH2_THEFI|nr:HEPN domain-containing protein [Thermus filiformis]KIX84341.1 DNA-binding protein [Thermus filiformis]
MPLDPTDPWSWFARAQSNLSKARLGRQDPRIFWEDLCFDAHQAVEKAFKGLLVALGQPFPRTHDLSRLLFLLRAHLEVPEALEAVARLNPYAVAGRYPGDLPEASREDWEEALLLAEQAVAWAEEVLKGLGGH